ncbi:cholinesterase 1-like [Patiria miniata]|uniref:Carboxylic ester hydrolase n=1 Tax=Patiria miniata TaxID=46514 RepID=A0A913ZB71_PATMI|nr:cholinesterase 1-like [Patiria miniata]
MSRHTFFVFLLGKSLIVLSFLVAVTTSQPRVTVEQGVIEGTTETFMEDEFTGAGGTKVDVFKGIPFAEPPLGELRFKPPVQKTAWSGVFDATYLRPACLQDPFYAYTLGFEMDEDCLQLNIFAPNQRVAGGAAVMVWIHGGGFTFGSAVQRVYNGLPLAAVGDVIIVTVNYRLGVFGFLSTDDEASPGNIAMLDNVMALKWVQQNIEAFGGDKQRVTIFGESAGAVNVGFLVLSEMAKGLFSQAIIESGGSISQEVGPLTEDGDKVLRERAFQLGETVGCSTSDSAALITCLQDVDGNDLIQAQLAVYDRMYPNVDGTFLTMTPLEAYASGTYNHVPMLIGTNRDEGTLFFAFNPLFVEYLTDKNPPFVNRTLFDALVVYTFKLFDLYDKAVFDAAEMKYIDWSQAEYEAADYFHSMVEFSGDWLFTCNVDKLARLHSTKDKVYRYLMPHVPTVSYYKFQGVQPGWVGAGHAEELPFVFGAAFVPGNPSVNLTNDEKVLSVNFMKLWTNFAKSGNPSKESPNSPPILEYIWPVFSSPGLEYKVLDLNLSSSRALKSDQCYFWNNYVEDLRAMLEDRNGVDSGVSSEWTGGLLAILATLFQCLCLVFSK